MIMNGIGALLPGQQGESFLVKWGFEYGDVLGVQGKLDALYCVCVDVLGDCWFCVDGLSLLVEPGGVAELAQVQEGLFLALVWIL